VPETRSLSGLTYPSLSRVTGTDVARQGLSTDAAILSENRYGWETRLGLTAPARHVTMRGGRQGP
jgi:hypothetical protein